MGGLASQRSRVEVSDLKLPGVEFREAYFTRTFSKNANLVRGGAQVHLADADTVDRTRQQYLLYRR